MPVDTFIIFFQPWLWKYCEFTCLFCLWLSICMLASPLGGFTEHEDLTRTVGFASDFQSFGNNVSQSPRSRARRSSLLLFQGVFPDQLETRQWRWPVGQVNQRPLVTVGLAGGFITNLSVLISLVMWRLPKKETRKSCVTKGETWRRAAEHWAWQSSLAGGGGWQRLAAEGFSNLPGMPTAWPAWMGTLQSDLRPEPVMLLAAGGEGVVLRSWWWC